MNEQEDLVVYGDVLGYGDWLDEDDNVFIYSSEENK